MEEILMSLDELKNQYKVGTPEHEAFKKAIRKCKKIIRNGLNDFLEDIHENGECDAVSDFFDID